MHVVADVLMLMPHRHFVMLAQMAMHHFHALIVMMFSHRDAIGARSDIGARTFVILHVGVRRAFPSGALRFLRNLLRRDLAIDITPPLDRLNLGAAIAVFAVSLLAFRRHVLSPDRNAAIATRRF